MISNSKERPAFFTPVSVILLGFALIGAVVAIYRLFAGLGSATRLNDAYPWGIWIGVDVLGGVALAAGGFTLSGAVYVFNMKAYRPVVVPATLTALIGYLIVIAAIFLDVGKPLSLWHPLVWGQHHSIMYEVVICIVLYTAVLVLEVAPPVLDRFDMKAPAEWLRKKWIVIILAIIGITLSYGHQSSLGGLFLITPRLHPLWYTPFLPQLFFVSAIGAGLAMVSIETVICARVMAERPDMAILRGLARGTAIALTAYAAFRFADLVLSGKLTAVFQGDTASVLFLLEIGIGVLLPMTILWRSRHTERVAYILTAQGLLIAGLLMNRLNVLFLAQAGTGRFYRPSAQELLLTIGLISLAAFLYRAAVFYLPVSSHRHSGEHSDR